MRGRRRFQDRRRNKGGATPLEAMLDMRRLDYFLYDVKELFVEMGVEENVYNPLLSSLVAKASRSAIMNPVAVGEPEIPIFKKKPIRNRSLKPSNLSASSGVLG